MVWVSVKRDDTQRTAAARNAALLDNENEYRRLLYVAMTRAADRLIVCGSVGEKAAPPGCWYQLIEQGLAATGLLTEEDGDAGPEKVRRYRKGASDAAIAPAAVAPTMPLVLPDWLSRNVAADPARHKPLTPSGFVDDAPQPGFVRPPAARERALKRGTFVHRLMQSLPDIPPKRRAEAARRFLARQRHDFSEAECAALTNQVMTILNDLRFAALFEPGSRAEVPIVGRVGDRTVNGTVDRLVVTGDVVLIADYKTNSPPPASLDEVQARYAGYVRQLALYRAVLRRLYPDRPVRAALVWTETLDLMALPEKALDEALAAALASP